MANVVFNGTILPVSAGPRPVTVVVTLPGGSLDTLPAVMTNAQGVFSTSKQYGAGTYSAKASVPADSLNKAGESPDTPFIVGLADTIVTLTVTVN